MRVIEQRIQRAQQAPKNSEGERDGGAIADIKIGVLGKLEHLERAEDTHQHNKGRHGSLQGGKQFIVERRFSFRRQFF